MLKIEPKNRITLLAMVVLALTGAVVPGLMNIGMLSSHADSTPAQGSTQLEQVLSKALTHGVAVHIGTVNVNSLPSPQENSQSAMLLSPLDVQKSSLRIAPQAPPGGGGGGGGGSSAVSVINGFEGLNMIQGGGYVPPDVQVATGPNHVVEMINLAGEVFTKQGAVVKSFSLQSFFNHQYLSDPKVLFDSSSGRWFASIIATTQTLGFGNVTLAVSNSNDPTGTWQLYNLVVNDFLPDQPLLGVSNDKVVVTANDFVGLYLGTGGGHQLYEGNQYWVLNKSELIAGSSNIDFDSVGPDPTIESVYPVQSLSSTTTQYMVTVGAASSGTSSTSVTVLSITGTPPGTVSVTSFSLPIATASIPPNALQPGTNINVTTNDFRVQSAAWFQGNLWYSLNDGCVPSGDTQVRSCARLTEISTSTNKIVQDVNYGASGQYYFFPAITIDGKGGMDAVYGYSSPTTYPSLAVTGQAPGGTAGSLAASQVLKQGSANDTSGRYGDFFGAAVDPSDTTIVWVAGEYHNLATGGCGFGLNCWSTFIGSMTGVSSFGISATPTYLFPTPGSSATSTITVASLAGFKGTASLTATVSVKGPNATLNPTSLALPPSGSSALTVTVPANFYSPFTVTVNATTGSAFHIVSVSVIPAGSPDFTIASSAIMVATPVYSAFNVGITLTSVNGFTGPISLSGTATPSNPVLSFSPSSVTLGQGSLGFSTLTITVYSGTPAGVYSLTVYGTSGSTSHSQFIALAVTPITFSFNNVAVFTGVKVNSTGSLSVVSPTFSPGTDAGALPISGTITVVATNSSTGSLIFSSSNTVTGLRMSPYYPGQGNGYATVVVVNVTASPYPLGVDAVLKISPTTTSSPGTPSISIAVTRNPDLLQHGSVDIIDYGYINYRATGCTPGMSCWDPRADLNADGVINATDASIDASYFNAINYNQFQFSVSGPSSLSIVQGFSVTSTVTVGAAIMTGFAGTVTLTTSAPLGLTATLSPTSIAVSGTSTLTISASSTLTTGQYSILITGNSGFTTKSTTITVAVSAPASDFTVSVSSSPLSIPQGFSLTPNVTLTSVGGFHGTVSLAVSSSFSALFASLNPSSIALSSGGTGTSALKVSSSTLGIFSVTITATSGSVSHSLNILVYVMNFIFDVNFSSGATKAGSPGIAFTFYMYSVNGPLTVTLNAKPSKSSVIVGFNTNPVNVPPGVVGSSTLGVKSNTVGIATINVTATSGPLIQFTELSVQFCSTFSCGGNCPPPPNPCPQSPSPGPSTSLQLDSGNSSSPVEIVRTAPTFLATDSTSTKPENS